METTDQDTIRQARRVFSAAWDAANKAATETYPKPLSDGFSFMDKNETKRECERWRLILDNGVPAECEVAFTKNLRFETGNFFRASVCRIADHCGLKTANVPTKKLIERLWEKARR